MSGASWPSLVAGAKAKASEVELKFDWIEGDWLPFAAGTKTDATYDLGSTSFQWRNLYLSGGYFAKANSSVAASKGGGTLEFLVSNTSNTANSHSLLYLLVGGASGGDPFIQFTVTSVLDWTLGLDNSDSDKFKLSKASGLGTNDVFEVNTALKFWITGGDFQVSRASSGGVVIAHFENSSNTAASDMKLAIAVGGASGGDPYIHFDGTGTDCSIGVDNSDNNRLKFAQATGVGVNDRFILDLTAGWASFGPNATYAANFLSVRTDSAENGGFWARVNNATGDPIFLCTTNATDWAFGVDNSDSDAFVVSASSALGTTNALKITTAGEITMPLQPAFLAYNSVDDTLVTDNTTLEFDTEVFDQGSDFNNSTDTFTAPVTGRYLFTVSLYFTNGTTNTSKSIELVTSNRTLVLPGSFADGAGGINASVITDMDAGDTASLVINLGSGTITAQGADSHGTTYFSGMLAA